MSRSSLTAAVCGAAAGLGLWASLGSIDRMQVPAGTVRVAMLPSLGTLALCLAAGALSFVLLHAVLSAIARHSAGALPPHGAATLAPLQVLAGGAVLVLPYLPWVADALPALMLLAGPGSRLAWGVLAALAVWAFVIERRAAHHDSRPDDGTRAVAMTAGAGLARRRRGTMAVMLASLLSSAVLARQFTRTPLFPGGDEPHYLVMAQSLWRDGDLRIENNHTRGDYQEYFHRPLTPHYLTRGVDGHIYSIHPIGLPVLMTPVYAAGGYDLVVYALLLLAAIAMTSAWRLAWAITGSASAATFAWAVLALGTPWIFNTFAVYPEIPAACACALAFAWTSGWHAGRDAHRRPLDVPVWRWWAAGLAIGTLPWFSTKYLVMAAVLGLVSLLRAWLPWPGDRAARGRALVRTVAVTVPNLLSLGAWLLFFRLFWGLWSPAAPYGAQRATRLGYLPEGGPGLLFDQEYGIVAFTPALLMVLPGLWAMWRQDGARRRVAAELVAVFGGLIGIVGAFHIWWGGSAIVGRPLVSAIPLLVLPVAAQWAACQTQPLRRAAQRILLCFGTALTVLLALAQDGLLLVAGRDGTSQVLEYLAPSTPVWTLLPTFLRQSPSEAWLGVLLWGGAALLVGTVMGRVGSLHLRRGFGGRVRQSPRLSRHQAGEVGHQHLAAWVIVVATGALVSGLAARVLTASTPAPALDERARVRLLDEFDAARRPLAIRYDPLTRLEPADLPPSFPLVVHTAGDRREDRTTKLFGRRLALPAGTYGVDLVFPGPSAAGSAAAPIEGGLAVHAGRTSPALEDWSVAVTPPGSWGRTFSLPVDIGFVGFKATPAITEASPRLRLTPQRIVDVSARPQTPAVLGSQAYAGLAVLVHGEGAWPEPAGIWLRGRATVMLTLVFPDDAWRTVDLRAGAVPIRVTAQWGGTTATWDLAPWQVARTVIDAPPQQPGQQGRSAQLRITSSDGFVPAEVEAGNRDRRLLGTWVELGRMAPGPAIGSLPGGLRYDPPTAPPATRR